MPLLSRVKRLRSSPRSLHSLSTPGRECMPIARTPALNRRRPVCSLAKARACVFAQVYRALESECQAELQKLRATQEALKSTPAPAAAHASPCTTSLASEHDSRAAGTVLAELASSSGSGAYTYALIGSWGVGLLCGWILRGKGAQRRERRTATGVEEMRGWMPVTDMKIS